MNPIIEDIITQFKEMGIIDGTLNLFCHYYTIFFEGVVKGRERARDKLMYYRRPRRTMIGERGEKYLNALTN